MDSVGMGVFLPPRAMLLFFHSMTIVAHMQKTKEANVGVQRVIQKIGSVWEFQS